VDLKDLNSTKSLSLYLPNLSIFLTITSIRMNGEVIILRVLCLKVMKQNIQPKCSTIVTKISIKIHSFTIIIYKLYSAPDSIYLTHLNDFSKNPLIIPLPSWKMMINTNRHVWLNLIAFWTIRLSNKVIDWVSLLSLPQRN